MSTPATIYNLVLPLHFCKGTIELPESSRILLSFSFLAPLLKSGLLKRLRHLDRLNLSGFENVVDLFEGEESELREESPGKDKADGIHSNEHEVDLHRWLANCV